MNIYKCTLDAALEIQGGETDITDIPTNVGDTNGSVTNTSGTVKIATSVQASVQNIESQTITENIPAYTVQSKANIYHLVF